MYHNSYKKQTDGTVLLNMQNVLLFLGKLKLVKEFLDFSSGCDWINHLNGRNEGI